MKVTNNFFPLNYLSLNSAYVKSLEAIRWKKLYKLTDTDDKAPIIEWRINQNQEIEEMRGHYQIRILNLPKDKRFHVSFLTKRMKECASYEFVRNDTRATIIPKTAIHESLRNVEVNTTAENVCYTQLTDLTSGKTYLYSCFARSIQQKRDNLTLLMNPLDDDSKEFLCVLSGLCPYENVSIKIGSNAKMPLSSSENGEVVFYLDEKNRRKGGERSLLIRRYLDNKSEVEFTYRWGEYIHLDEGMNIINKVAPMAPKFKRVKRINYEQTIIYSRTSTKCSSFWANKGRKS